MYSGICEEARTSYANIFLGEKELEEFRTVQFLALNIERQNMIDHIDIFYGKRASCIFVVRNLAIHGCNKQILKTVYHVFTLFIIYILLLWFIPYYSCKWLLCIFIYLYRRCFNVQSDVCIHNLTSFVLYLTVLYYYYNLMCLMHFLNCL